jgi:hypothetical protein
VDLAAADSHSVLTFALTGAAWGRILTELVASGLLTTTFTLLRDFDEAILDLVVATPANLDILAGDYLAAPESFDTPAVAGVPGRAAVAARPGVRRVAAIAAIAARPAVAGPPSLAFISMATITRLHEATEAAPLLALGLLAGLLGPVSTRVVRIDGLSTVRTSTAILAPNLARHLGLTGPLSPDSNPALAVQLRAFVLAAFDALTKIFATSLLTEASLQAEATDAFRYLLGTAAERTAVEKRRIGFIQDKCLWGCICPHCVGQLCVQWLCPVALFRPSCSSILHQCSSG